MNQLVYILLAIVFILFVAIATLIFIIFNSNDKKSTPPREKEPTAPKMETPSYKCEVNDTEVAVATCAICEKALGETAVHEIDKMTFCPEHYPLYIKSDWETVASVSTNPDEPEKGVFLYNFKESEWKQYGTPMYISTHYQINVETDQIESQVSLHCMKGQREQLYAKIPK